MKKCIQLIFDPVKPMLSNILQFGIVYIQLSTLSCRVSYVPRLAKVVNFLATRNYNH